jgi:hypothetical protein
MTGTDALYQVTGLPYGRYRAWFALQDNAGNSILISHEFYVDEIEFLISQGELDIGDISDSGIIQTSADELIITVRTVGAAFDVTMNANTNLLNLWEEIPVFDGAVGFWYRQPPYTGPILSHLGGVIIWWESAFLHPDGFKNQYQYRVRYSAIVDIIENYAAWDYEWNVDFGIEIEY